MTAPPPARPADEPDGPLLDPAVLVMAYGVIKQLDPHHPVNIVLNCAGAVLTLS